MTDKTCQVLRHNIYIFIVFARITLGASWIELLGLTFFLQHQFWWMHGTFSHMYSNVDDFIFPAGVIPVIGSFISVN